MTLHAGHCSTCDCEIFRFAAHGRTGERVMLYPLPDSVYARVGKTPGIGFCAQHTPTLGVEGVTAIDSAGYRYAHWFSQKFGDHLRAWVGDHLELPEHAQAALMDQWELDRKATEAVHA